MDGTQIDGAETSAVEVINPEGDTPLVIIGDHAGCAVPRDMISDGRPLGLPEADLRRHIGWDIGAGAVARQLAARLNATAVLAVYTRLLIDPNRPLGDPDCIPRSSDGIPIPANQDLALWQRQARAAALYWPYHTRIDLELARLQQRGLTPLLLSLHSFTPALMLRGSARPWHVGVMASRDRRFAEALLASFRSRRGFCVGDNEPYSGITHGYALKIHGLAQGLPHAQIELRQDLVCTAAGQAWWAALLAEVLAPIVADERLRRVEHY